MILNTEKCGYCGTCVNICPNNSLELTECQIIMKSDKCDNCGKCTIICPLGAFELEARP